MIPKRDGTAQVTGEQNSCSPGAPALRPERAEFIVSDVVAVPETVPPHPAFSRS